MPPGTEGVATVRLTRDAARSVRRAVRRNGSAAIGMRGFVDDGRLPERGTLFVVDRYIRDPMSTSDSRSG